MKEFKKVSMVVGLAIITGDYEKHTQIYLTVDEEQVKAIGSNIDQEELKYLVEKLAVVQAMYNETHNKLTFIEDDFSLAEDGGYEFVYKAASVQVVKEGDLDSLKRYNRFSVDMSDAFNHIEEFRALYSSAKQQSA